MKKKIEAVKRQSLEGEGVRGKRQDQRRPPTDANLFNPDARHSWLTDV